MRHFSIEDWAEAARGVVTEEQKRAMHKHLDEGCDRCAKTFSMWQRVTEIARREPSYDPPEPVLRSVKAQFARERPKTTLANTVRVARLIFDSFRQPVPVGIRAVGRPVRQVLYKAGDYYVDLRIERQSGVPQASLLGQVLRHPDKPVGTGELPVTLARGKTPIVHTVTNPLGEFQLEIDAGKDHDISILVDRDLSLMVPLRKSRRM